MQNSSVNYTITAALVPELVGGNFIIEAGLESTRRLHELERLEGALDVKLKSQAVIAA